jgi:hypothetical protein
MYRLMMSEKLDCDALTDGSMPSYRQTEVNHFARLQSALEACELANYKGKSRFYVLNDLGKEYYDCVWID